MFLIFTIIFVALIFEFINGFHDTANAIATSVATKVMPPPRQAVAISAIFNLVGALVGIEIVNVNFVTRNMSQTHRTRDECIFMLPGEVIEHSRTEDLFLTPKHPKTAEYIEGRHG